MIIEYFPYDAGTNRKNSAGGENGMVIGDVVAMVCQSGAERDGVRCSPKPAGHIGKVRPVAPGGRRREVPTGSVQLRRRSICRLVTGRRRHRPHGGRIERGLDRWGAETRRKMPNRGRRSD